MKSRLEKKETSIQHINRVSHSPLSVAKAHRPGWKIAGRSYHTRGSQVETDPHGKKPEARPGGEACSSSAGAMRRKTVSEKAASRMPS